MPFFFSPAAEGGAKEARRFSRGHPLNEASGQLPLGTPLRLMRIGRTGADPVPTRGKAYPQNPNESSGNALEQWRPCGGKSVALRRASHHTGADGVKLNVKLIRAKRRGSLKSLPIWPQGLSVRLMR